MIGKRIATLLSMLILGFKVGSAQIRFAYYDVDQLYDTEESLFYDDTRYTPQGQYRWDAERYRRKVEQVAARIDSTHCEVVALYGVENEQVVRDIASRLQGDYAYLHRTLNTLDGMDFALLYYADRCEPLDAEPMRSMLCIEARIDRDTFDIILGVDPRFVRLEAQELRKHHPSHRLLVAGKISSIAPERLGLVDRLAEPARRGHGNRMVNGEWQLRDRIFTDTLAGRREGAVLIRREWLDPLDGAPTPTYESGRYRGGAGRNLPIWCEIE